ncbi:MAG TPA: hypothetical protein VEY10_19905 [Flavisolibacter sp.]|jgi:hypothetical protein|nr:hypothetical protein [Flavisolibacter sp.]
MVAATLEEQKRAKIKFFAVYIASVVLIVLIISSFWKTGASASAVDTTPVGLPTENEKLVREDALLHSKLEALDTKYSLALSGGKSGMAAQQANLQGAERDFAATLDSLENGAASVQDAQQKTALINIIAGFRKSFDSRRELMNSYTKLLSDTTKTSAVVRNTSGASNEEMQELKAILVEKEERVAALEKKRIDDLAEKDRIISSLQTQVGQKTKVPVQTKSTASDNEWQQKYAKLKASYDNMANQNNTLNRSYKSIVDDNRRLLSQLQAARKQ